MSRTKTHRLIGMVLAVVALLTIGIGQASADPILVSQSRSDFFDTGGTLVTGCIGLGCAEPTFSYGNVSGTNTWSLFTKVFTDAGQTIFEYSILNNTLSPNISSFHIMNNGSMGTGFSPGGWGFSQSGAWWSWETNSPTVYGIEPSAGMGGLGGFSVVVDDSLPITFNPTFSTTSDGMTTTVMNTGGTGEWFVAAPGGPVPEPTSLLLLGSGMAGFGAWRRRRVQQ